MQGLVQSWSRRGLVACALWPLSLLYAGVTALRRLLHRAGIMSSRRMPVPVVIIGNLIAGGAGKTPATIETVALLREQGWTPGVVSRGYGRADDTLRAVTAASSAAEAGDEPLLIHLRTRAPTWVGRDRPAAAAALLAAHPEVDILVCDDGLQHLALARDLSVLVFDERGAGNGWLLPAGPLREPLPRTLPENSLVLYNAPEPSTRLPGILSQRRLAGAVPLAGWWAGETASLLALKALAGQPVLAAAGLARPERFFAMLRDQGLTITPLPLPDHHGFEALPWPAGTSDVLVTEKDAVKLPPARLAGMATRVWVVALDFAPDPAYAAALARRLQPLRHAR